MREKLQVFDSKWLENEYGDYWDQTYLASTDLQPRLPQIQTPLYDADYTIKWLCRLLLIEQTDQTQPKLWTKLKSTIITTITSAILRSMNHDQFKLNTTRSNLIRK